MNLNRTDYQYICGLVRQHSAIALEDGKEYLAESRLQALVQREGMESVGALVKTLRCDPGHVLLRKVVEAMTTNETSFFRDTWPYEAIRRVLIPEILGRRAQQRSIRIWSAACSSGQEPYSLAMLLRENFPQLASWQVKLLATDLSTEMVERARAGRYSQLEVNRGVPLPMLIRYFVRHGTEWTIDDSLRRMVEFKAMNLVAAWPPVESMDLVLLRNVLIYFDADAKKQVLDRIASVMSPDGYLIMGGSETTLFSTERFNRIEVAGCPVYRLKR